MSRDIDCDHFMRYLEIEDNYVYIRIGVFDVKIKHESEGIVVDVYSAIDETRLEPLTTCYALDDDAAAERKVME